VIASVSLVLTNKTLQIQPLERATLRTAVLGYPLEALFVSLIFIAVLGAPEAGIRWTCLPALKYLGRISYGLYVFHRLCYLIAESFLGVVPGLMGYFVTVAVAFCLTLAFAGISYRFFEQPFLLLKKRFTFIPSDQPLGSN